MKKQTKEPNLKKEMIWSIFMCMFAICMVLCIGICGLFAYYMHGSFKTPTTTEITQTSDGDFTQNNQSITK